MRKATEQYKSRSPSYVSAGRQTGSNGLPTPNSTLNGEDAAVNGACSAAVASRLIPVDKGFTQGHSLVLARSNNFNNTIISPIPLLSPHLERSQLYNEFVTTYLPITRGGAQNGHFSFYQTIVHKQSEELALQQGLDALSLVQVGSLYKNQQLMLEAKQKYGKALRSLRFRIAQNPSLYDDELLAALTVLATCELYEGLQSDISGWGSHVEGANRLVAMRGPDSIRSDLALLLFSNMRHGSLLHALINRKAPFMASPEWREVAFRVPNSVLDHSTSFYDKAIQVPGLLERHDKLDLELPSALDDIDRLLADCDKLEGELRHWFTEWQEQGKLEYRTLRLRTPIDEFPTFTTLCKDRTFEEAYWFYDFLVAYLHSLYYMVMHYLRTDIQSLHRHRHTLLPDWYPKAKSVVPEDELLGLILELCRCIPFFVEPISSSTGHIGIFLPMRCASIYFREHDHWKYLKWIGEVKGTVFTKGLVPPTVQHNAARLSPGPRS